MLLDSWAGVLTLGIGLFMVAMLIFLVWYFVKKSAEE
jgi:Mg2+ and Co2+ transporter CorA